MRTSRSAFLRPVLAVAILTALPFSGCNRRELPPEIAQIIEATITSEVLPVSLTEQKERARAWKEMRSFYEKRQFQPAWVTEKGPRPETAELLKAIDASAIDGLDPARYQKERLSSFLEEAGSTKWYGDPAAQRRLAYVDMHLTHTFLSLAAHLATGRQQPETLRIDWYTKPRNVDLDARLEAALDGTGHLDEALASLRPHETGYRSLADALARYREIAARGGWTAVSPGKEILRPGSRGQRVAELKSRLRVEEDLSSHDAGAAESDLYDSTLAAAVTRFQERHGLEATGKVDADTLKELNVPAAARVRQIEINLERWRWLPSDLGERYIRVNIPEYEMALIEKGRPVLEMRVVVGKAQQSRTPVFSDKMTYLEVNPAWNIPSTIAEEEILPKAAADPGYLAKNGIEVVQEGSQTRLRQRPGRKNPLGQVKFMFPNEFDIYLHDTPANHLFSEAERDFSHGCIRLERPMALAHALLAGSEWTPEKLQATVASGEQKAITLPRPLPVHLLYFTAWVDEEGTVEFRRDIYGHDVRLAKALAEEPIVELDLGAVRGQARAEA